MITSKRIMTSTVASHKVQRDDYLPVSEGWPANIIIYHHTPISSVLSTRIKY